MRRVVVLTFNDPADLVTISATTTLGTAKRGTEEAGQIEDEREALLAGRDEWSARFANAARLAATLRSSSAPPAMKS